MRKFALGFALIAAASAVLLISDLGQRHAKARTSNSKTWRIHILELSNSIDVEECEHGIFDGFAEEKLVRGRDFEAKVSNAQGDMGVINGMVDAALGQAADLLITMSTPTLQAALQRTQGKTPVVFTYVANAIKAGAGKTNEDHMPNVTGVTMLGAFPEMIALIKELLPNTKKIGTLFVPAEVNMVISRDELRKAANKAGIELVAVGVSTSADVPDAAQALVARGIDVLCQLPGNLAATSFAGIAGAANRRKLPVLAFQQAQIKEGATIVLARDYYDAGRHAAFLAARVMRGESPAKIPFEVFTKTKLFIHQGAASRIGLRLPPDLLAQAAKVIKD